MQRADIVKILLTGATGYLGSNIIKALLKKGQRDR